VNGFEARPPQNIHEIVSRLGLGDDEERDVLGNLSDQYPNGLGVNYVG
jgi:hypothetical protein